jgi:hypothetical protein
MDRLCGVPGHLMGFQSGEHVVNVQGVDQWAGTLRQFPLAAPHDFLTPSLRTNSYSRRIDFAL